MPVQQRILAVGVEVDCGRSTHGSADDANYM
jgi:hypothetical protein